MIKKANKSNIHTVSLLVANKPGVLVRVALVFARRGYNIDSLVVSPSFNPDYSRMTITAKGDPETLDQIIKQAGKLVDVIQSQEHDEEIMIHSELGLVKLKNVKANRAVINKLVKKYDAKIVEENDEALIISIAATTDELDEFESVFKKYNVIEMARSGKLAITKGKEKT